MNWKAPSAGDDLTIYCYSDLNGGNVFEHKCPMGKAPETLTIADVVLSRDYVAEHCGQKSGDAWTQHWSPAMGARTPRHGREIAGRCLAAGVDVKFQFGDYGPMEVKSRDHQKKLMPVAHADRGKMVNFDDY